MLRPPRSAARGAERLVHCQSDGKSPHLACVPSCWSPPPASPLRSVFSECWFVGWPWCGGRWCLATVVMGRGRHPSAILPRLFCRFACCASGSSRRLLAFPFLDLTVSRTQRCEPQRVHQSSNHDGGDGRIMIWSKMVCSVRLWGWGWKRRTKELGKAIVTPAIQGQDEMSRGWRQIQNKVARQFLQGHNSQKLQGHPLPSDQKGDNHHGPSGSGKRTSRHSRVCKVKEVANWFININATKERIRQPGADPVGGGEENHRIHFNRERSLSARNRRDARDQ